MATWFLDLLRGNLNLVVGDDVIGEVRNVRLSKHPGKVKVLLENEQVSKLDLADYNVEDASILTAIKPSPGRRSHFINEVKKYLNDNSDSFESSPCSDDKENDDATQGTPQTYSDCELGSKLSPGLQDKKLRDHFLGTFDVHVENLVAPDSSRATRHLDHSHISHLEDSFSQHQAGQVVIMVGMVSECVNADDLGTKGNARVEVLGGNHSREALQTLHRKGMPGYEFIKVNIFKCLDKVSALALGYKHNLVLHERKKPMNFIDKVRLMRKCENEDITQWKDMLVIIFKVKSRRVLTQTYSLHLKVARLSEELYTCLLSAVKNIQVNEKFFRQMMRLSTDEEIMTCLQTLESSGEKAFKKKVHQLIVEENGLEKKTAVPKKLFATIPAEDSATDKATVSGGNNVGHVETQQTDYLKDLERLQVKHSQLEERLQRVLAEKINLQEENESLRARLENEKEQRGMKRKAENECSTEYQKGDQVKAFWRDDGGESWLDAEVMHVYANGQIKVRYWVDKTTSQLPRSWVKN